MANCKRTRLQLSGLYAKDGDTLAAANLPTDPDKVLDVVIIGLNNSCYIDDLCKLYLYFLHTCKDGLEPGWRTQTIDLYDKINPFRDGRDKAADKIYTLNLVDNCLRSDFWGGRPCPLNSADVEAIRAILYDKIDKHPYLN